MITNRQRTDAPDIYACALVSHLVYGFMTEVARRALRQAL